jgi:hypothetical protein
MNMATHDLAYLQANGIRGLAREQALAANADDATVSLTGHLAASGAMQVASPACDNFVAGLPIPISDTVAELQRNADALSYIENGIREAITIIQGSPGVVAAPPASTVPAEAIAYPPSRASSRTWSKANKERNVP